MIKRLTLTNEQAITLYNFLQNIKLDRTKNRNRWKFLEVIEDKVFAYEKYRDEKVELAKQSQQEAALFQSEKDATTEEKSKKQKDSIAYVKTLQDQLNDLSKEKQIFDFNDREAFVQGKAIFEQGSGTSEQPEELTGQQSKLVKQIEDAFMEAQDFDTQPKQQVAQPKEVVN